jgi:hypothetical protein
MTDSCGDRVMFQRERPWQQRQKPGPPTDTTRWERCIERNTVEKLKIINVHRSGMAATYRSIAFLASLLAQCGIVTGIFPYQTLEWFTGSVDNLWRMQRCSQKRKSPGWMILAAVACRRLSGYSTIRTYRAPALEQKSTYT